MSENGGNGKIPTWFMLIHSILTGLITAGLIASVGFLFSINARMAVVETQIKLGNDERVQWRAEWSKRLNDLETAMRSPR